MVYTATTCKYVFNMKPGDVYWCTADCGWITGHSYLTYGPMLVGATNVVFEGVPTYPDAGRCWAVVDKYKVRGGQCDLHCDMPVFTNPFMWEKSFYPGGICNLLWTRVQRRGSNRSYGLGSCSSVRR